MFNPADVQGEFQFKQGSLTWSNTTPQRIVGANPNRVILYVRVFGANAWDAWLGQFLGITPATWHFASNASFSWTWIDDGVLPSQEWWLAPETPLSAAQASWCEVIFIPSGMMT